MAELLFGGAAGEVTGSRHLLKIGEQRLLLDCGLFQGHRKEADAKNRLFVFDPKLVDAVVLSHAHMDHGGALPRLVAQGFKGLIFCTPATAELLMLLLQDSAHIQEQDAIFFNKKNPFRPVKPLYTAADAEAVRPRLRPVPYGLAFEPLPGIKAYFHEAGHILGSAMVSLRWQEAGKDKSLLFSGDLGRTGMPLLKDPFHPSADTQTLIVESTYGDRDHSVGEGAEAQLGQAISEAFARGGKVLIPSFAVGRTQELIWHLAALKDHGTLPMSLKVYIDSPLATKVTQVFSMHREVMDQEFQQAAKRYDPFESDWLRYVESVEESKALNERMGPCVIIAGSGMAESGRILHHLRNGLGDPANLVLIVGYQAEGTLGRRLLEGQREVLIYGMPVQRRCPVRALNAFSAHAGRTELLAWLLALPRPQQVFLVHGEPRAAQALSYELQARSGWKPVLPRLRDRALV